MCFAVIGNGFIRKDNAAHIVGCFVDCKRCRQFDGIIIGKGYGRLDFIRSRVRVGRFLVIRYFRARRQTCNGKRFGRAVVGRGYIFKSHSRKIVIFQRYRPGTGYVFIIYRKRMRSDGSKFGFIIRRKIVGGQRCRFSGIIVILYRDCIIRITEFVHVNICFARYADRFKYRRIGFFGIRTAVLASRQTEYAHKHSRNRENKG